MKFLKKEYQQTTEKIGLKKTLLIFLTLKITNLNQMKLGKIKFKSFKGESMNRLKHLAEWRENLSINRNVTKNKIARDEVLLEIASNDPKNIKDFRRIRGFKLDNNKKTIDEILLILEKAREVPKELWPVKNVPKKNKINKPAVLELLKVLLACIRRK